HIGFLFLVQSDYERAARLDVNPMPDVVTRVFLLFKGVDADQTSEWKKPDEVDWVKKVGVQVDKVTDDSLFRVLEWGGMEAARVAQPARRPFPTLVHAFMAPPTTSNKRAASPPSDPSKTKRAREDPAVECCYLAVVKDDERQVLVRISSADYDTAMREIRRVFCVKHASLTGIERDVPGRGWTAIGSTAWMAQAVKRYDELYPVYRMVIGGRVPIQIFVKTLTGRTPVIYLFPPTPLDSASVSLTLTPEWHFSALYPVVHPVEGGNGETRASWTVSAQPDGSLVDLASGLELKYLFWEAEAYKTTS
ncbi:hypothetical protein BJY59DRAFT_710714, partial [Rhodotorula toruloides]